MSMTFNVTQALKIARLTLMLKTGTGVDLKNAMHLAGLLHDLESSYGHYLEGYESLSSVRRCQRTVADFLDLWVEGK